MVGEVEDEPQQQSHQQQLQQQQQLSEAPRHPISMRVVLVSVDEPDTCVLRDVHYASAPASMARIRQDVGYILSQHGFSAAGPSGEEEEQRLVKTHGILRVTSGKEAPGVQVLGGRRVVLFSPVVWECRATGEEGENVMVEERIGEAARMGDWLVFVLELPGVGGLPLLMPPPPPIASTAGPGSVARPGSTRGSRAPSAAGSPAASARGSRAPSMLHSGSPRVPSEHTSENGTCPCSMAPPCPQPTAYDGGRLLRIPIPDRSVTTPQPPGPMHEQPPSPVVAGPPPPDALPPPSVVMMSPPASSVRAESVQ